MKGCEMPLSPDELAIILPASEFRHYQTSYYARTQEAYDGLPEEAGWQVRTIHIKDRTTIYKERLPFTKGWVVVHQPMGSRS